MKCIDALNRPESSITVDVVLVTDDDAAGAQYTPGVYRFSSVSEREVAEQALRRALSICAADAWRDSFGSRVTGTCGHRFGLDGFRQYGSEPRGGLWFRGLGNLIAFGGSPSLAASKQIASEREQRIHDRY